jgi:hypothetical protein
MSDAVLVALIAGGASIFSGLVSSFIAVKLISWRVEQLEKKVEKHNDFMSRIALLEADSKKLDHMGPMLDRLARLEEANKK